MQVTCVRIGDSLVVAPEGRVDESSWKEFDSQLASAVVQASRETLPTLIIDLSRLDYMSSRGLRALTIAGRRSRRRCHYPPRRPQRGYARDPGDQPLRPTVRHRRSCADKRCAMIVRFWGTRGVVPVAPRRRSTDERSPTRWWPRTAPMQAEGFAQFIDENLSFASRATYGGATSCVEIEGGNRSFFVCDMGCGLREFGIDALALRRGVPGADSNFFLSHLHWDHIMGFPFFLPAFDPDSEIVIHSGHADAEAGAAPPAGGDLLPGAVRLAAGRGRVRHHASPASHYEVGGLTVDARSASIIRTAAIGYRFRTATDGRVVYSTDSEHKVDDMDGEDAFVAFFEGADLVICDTMYSLGDSGS